MMNNRKSAVNFVALICFSIQFVFVASSDYSPGDAAPNFTLPTLTGPFVYKGINNTNIPTPIIFHEFTNHSAFLECLWMKDSSLISLIENSPDNVHYVFLSSEPDAKTAAQWMSKRFSDVLDQYYFESAGNKGVANQRSEIVPQRLRSRIDRRSVIEDDDDDINNAKTKFQVSNVIDDSPANEATGQKRQQKVTEEEFKNSWKKRLHFVTIPLYEVGNWIPLVTSRWYCSGHGCGFDQIAVETEEVGDTLLVAKRLDARYDWLPSAYSLKAKHPRIPLIGYGTGCDSQDDIEATGKVVVISNKECTYAEKVLTAQKAGALAVVVYANTSTPIDDMTCTGDKLCSETFNIPATMVSHRTGIQLLERLKGDNVVYIKFQHTPSRNFFFAIDEQGKIQEVGWLLFPSMIFLTYEAEWLNYMTSFIGNMSGHARVITVFNSTIMKGEKGVQRTIEMPPLTELQLYRHVELEVELGCPGPSDFSCPHWDHTVQLTVCCSPGKLCNKEIGRWITPFRRQIGKWLTPVRPLIPLFSGTTCNFTMKTEPWAMPWKPSLKIRLVDKMEEREKSFVPVPYDIVPLFDGGTFDKNYNKKFKPIHFAMPEQAVKVELVSVITGHGSDNNNCAEFCITEHVFTVNGKYKSSQVFNNAGTAFGCAENVRFGVEPNEHGTWLYGRDGWCDGQDVVPWVKDITDQLNNKDNIVAYKGMFNNTDPNPSRDAGKIIMSSYLVFYKHLN